ncbi:MAG: hypothetical protein HY321_09870 [Armatimonadetes bacterium]|nr:hypothetical protein [Armatimonadota bacterium]
MIERKLILFEKPGPECTGQALRAAAERARELGIRDVVVASSTGQTALRAADAFAGQSPNLVAVTLMAGVWKQYGGPDPEKVRQAEAKGVRFLTATHALMGNVENALMTKFGGIWPGNVIAYTLYLFGQGMKVAVEVAVMAADAGLISSERECIALAGSDSGADAAIVLKPACSNHLFDLQVREVICMPREKRSGP